MVITTRSKKYDDIVSSIILLPPEQWSEAATTAIEKEKTSNRKGAEKLAEQLSTAFEAAAKKHEVVAKILRKDVNLDPASVTFSVFRTRRLAQLIKKDPDMFNRLKTAAESASLNEGYTHCWKLLDNIAENHDLILSGIEVACGLDDKQGVSDKCSLKECLIAMDYLVENYYDAISRIFEEYRSVTRMEELEEHKDEGRPTRKRVQKKLD